MVQKVISYVLFFILIIICVLDTNNAFRVFDLNGIETILAVENETITLGCNKDVPMSYCGFIHPNGSRFAITGVGLHAGHCSINIKVTERDTGPWRCNIGTKEPGLETVQMKYVRLTDKLAALDPNVTLVHGKVATLMCTTTQNLTPLRYCRFEPPTGSPFNIDSKITLNNPIMQRYYFPENKSLDRGDCAVTIKKVKYEDVGDWMCGAGLDSDDKEYADVIKIHVEGLYTISSATAIWTTLGIVCGAVVVGIIGLVIWNRQLLCHRDQQRENEEIEMNEPRFQSFITASRSVPNVLVQSPSPPEPHVSL